MAKNRNNVKTEVKWYYLLPLALIISIVPLIVFLKQVPVAPEVATFWKHLDNDTDFFSYAKTRWLLMLTVFSFVSLVTLYLQKKIVYRHNNLYIPLGIYAFFVMLSTVFAEYKVVALHGFPERYEGMYVVLAYILLTFMAAHFVQNEKHIKVLIGSLFASATVAGTIGIFQFFGYDFFRMEIGKKLILPSQLYHIADTLNFTFGPHTIYSTMYNTNYVGSYTILILPLAIAAFLYFKDYRYKIAAGLFTALIFANWLGSNSRAGYVGGMIALLFLIVLLRKQLLTNWKPLLAVLSSFIIIFYVMDTVSGGRLTGEYASIIPQPEMQTEMEGQESTAVAPVLQDIIVADDQTTIVTDRHSLVAILEDDALSFEDSQGEIIPLIATEEDNQYTLEGEEYSSYTITMHTNAIYVQFSKYNFYLGLIDNRLVFLDAQGKEAIIDSIPSFGFEGRELWGSSRGYIWSRSLPLLKDTIIIGHGQDTYPIYFPQHDYIGKLNYLSGTHQIVDKPHNFYLQIGIQTGVISLIAVLIMFALYAIDSLRLYIRNTNHSLMHISGAAIFTSVLGYLAAAFFNDSLVSVAPVFWILFGIGIACNYWVKQQKETSVGT